jgi:hypothetical protein
MCARTDLRQDSFTTDYFLPDDFYGNIAGGNYTLVRGKMNMLTGNYTELPNQMTENIYSSGESPTLRHSQCLSHELAKRVGIAIPASEVSEAP